MSKATKKKQQNQYNPAILKRLKEKYNVTVQFITASIRGDRNSNTSIDICADYKKMENEVNKAIKKI
jgi:uncharacterized protein YlxP (DUF503 family)